MYYIWQIIRMFGIMALAFYIDSFFYAIVIYLIAYELFDRILYFTLGYE
jgi:hypothetical protein